MSALGLLLVLVPGLVFTGLVMVGVALYLVGRTRPQRSGNPPLPPGAQLTPGPPPAAVEVWRARVGLPGSASPIGASGSTYGVLRLVDGALEYLPDGAAAPAWAIPCTALGVSEGGDRMLGGGVVELRWAHGMLRCTVSREHVHRAATDPFKAARERRYARELAAALAAHGAHVRF